MLNNQLAWLRDDSGKTVMHIAAEQGLSLVYCLLLMFFMHSIL